MFEVQVFKDEICNSFDGWKYIFFYVIWWFCLFMQSSWFYIPNPSYFFCFCFFHAAIIRILNVDLVVLFVESNRVKFRMKRHLAEFRAGTGRAYYGRSKFNLFYRGIIAGRIERLPYPNSSTRSPLSRKIMLNLRYVFITLSFSLYVVHYRCREMNVDSATEFLS